MRDPRDDPARRRGAASQPPGAGDVHRALRARWRASSLSAADVASGSASARATSSTSPDGAPHAWRNPAGKPSVVADRHRGPGSAASSPRWGGRSAQADEERPVHEEQLARFLAVAERYGYWNATPEENAAVGISLPARARLTASALRGHDGSTEPLVGRLSSGPFSFPSTHRQLSCPRGDRDSGAL